MSLTKTQPCVAALIGLLITFACGCHAGPWGNDPCGHCGYGFDSHCGMCADNVVCRVPECFGFGETCWRRWPVECPNPCPPPGVEGAIPASEVIMPQALPPPPSSPPMSPPNSLPMPPPMSGASGNAVRLELPPPQQAAVGNRIHVLPRASSDPPPLPMYRQVAKPNSPRPLPLGKMSVQRASHQEAPRDPRMPHYHRRDAEAKK